VPRGPGGKHHEPAPAAVVPDPLIERHHSGLLHALLDIETWDDLVGHPVAGPSWEGFVIENLVVAAAERWVPYFYRTADGAEIDLLLERGGRVELAVEIKRSTAPEVSRGFHLACDDLGVRERLLVHGGREEWRMPGGVLAVPLPGLVNRLASSTGR